MHAPGLGEENAAILGDRRGIIQQMLEHRTAGAFRMRALRHVRQLLRIAEQDDVARGGADGNRIRERRLAGLVDEQIIERLVECRAREQPRRAGDELRRRLLAVSCCRTRSVMKRPSNIVSSLTRSLLQSRERDALRDGNALRLPRAGCEWRDGWVR